MYKQHSILNAGNVNADFKLLTHNWYSAVSYLLYNVTHNQGKINFRLGVFFSNQPECGDRLD